MEKNFFPQKKVYIYLSSVPLAEGKFNAIEDRKFSISDELKNYSNNKWELENKNDISSIFPSVIEVDCSKDSMTLHCGITEYKYLIGMVKFAQESKRIPSDLVNGLSIGITPITRDKCIVLDRRIKTQHGFGFYDIPTSGKNAEIFFEESQKKHPELVKNIFDTIGFPKWNLIRHFNLKPEEIEKIFYIGFAKGFEVSLEAEFTGYCQISLTADELKKRMNVKDRLYYKLDDLLELLNSIGNDGKIKNIKEDIYGNIPCANPQTKKFALVENEFANILGVLRQFKGEQVYQKAVNILKAKGYELIFVEPGRIKLAELN
jgi:hypothetical protein